MHSGFEIPGSHHHHHQQQQQQQPESSCSPHPLSMNPTHILDPIHSLPTSLDPSHHFLPHPHPYAAAAAPSSTFFPLNFKLGLNEICSTTPFKNGAPPDSLLRGSEQYQMLHPPFWEAVSNENSEIVDQRETLTPCLDAKTRPHFTELDAIYKIDSTQTPPPSIQTLPSHFPSSKKKKKQKPFKKKTPTTATTTTTTSCDGDEQLVAPMAEFFEDLIKQVMEHQESLQKKFTQVMDRLSEERRARDEAWRSEELAHFEREAAARAHERAMAKSREAMIVSYLEKITGQRINLPPLAAAEITATNTSDHSNCGGSENPTTFC